MSENIDTWLEEGLRFYSQGDPSRALEAWFRILDVDPAHSLAQQYVAYVRQVYRLDATNPGAPGATTSTTADTGPPASSFDAAVSLSSIESLPPVPVPDKKPVVGLDASSSWSDVVDSAFDVGVADTEPKAVAKMAARDPWSTKPDAAVMPSPSMPSMPTPSTASAFEPPVPPSSFEPPMPPPIPPPMPPPMAPPDMAVLAPPMPPASIEPAVELPSAAAAVEVPPPAQAHFRAPVQAPGSQDAGFDPWRGDTLPPIVDPSLVVQPDVPSFEIPPTPPPVADGDLGIDISMDEPPALLPPPAAVSPAQLSAAASAPSASSSVHLSGPALSTSQDTVPHPAWRPPNDDVGAGIRKVGGSRVDVLPTSPKAPTPPPKTGPVEERVVKMRRFDDFSGPGSGPIPRAPSAAAAPTPAVGVPAPSSNPFRRPPGTGSDSSPASPSPAVSVSPFATKPPLDLTPVSVSAPTPAIEISAPHESHPPGDLSPGMVVDPWDEVAGPGGALDLDKSGPQTSKFDELLSSGSKGGLEAWPSPPPEPAEDQCTALMRGAKELFDLGDFSGSLDLVEKVLKIDAENESARAYMKRNESTLIKMYESKLGDMRRSPRQLMPPDEVIWMNMHHKAGFILSQIDGQLSYEDLLEISGMPRFDTMRILHDLAHQGIIG